MKYLLAILLGIATPAAGVANERFNMDARKYLQREGIAFIDHRDWLVIDRRSTSPLNVAASQEYELTRKEIVILTNPYMYGWPSKTTIVLSLDHSHRFIQGVQDGRPGAFDQLKRANNCREVF